MLLSFWLSLGSSEESGLGDTVVVVLLCLCLFVCFGLFWFGFWFFETGFLCIALAVLELTL